MTVENKALEYIFSNNEKYHPELLDKAFDPGGHYHSYNTLLNFAIQRACELHYVQNNFQYAYVFKAIQYLVENQAPLNKFIMKSSLNESISCEPLFNYLLEKGARLKASELNDFQNSINQGLKSYSINQIKTYLIFLEKDKLENITNASLSETTTKNKMKL
jgi:hypothetical protein